ncbi:MAG: hypothetical protein CVV27_01520 [Candidatus Melainabacteria bacterium HGW-Melainabacteria-1]|nr:MAG: hypothetical protein CVV27_01520 [Candidatus Melainabacteria bacterium HGW-Melainabacteria-1]
MAVIYAVFSSDAPDFSVASQSPEAFPLSSKPVSGFVPLQLPSQVMVWLPEPLKSSVEQAKPVPWGEYIWPFRDSVHCGQGGALTRSDTLSPCKGRNSLGLAITVTGRLTVMLV